MLVLLAVTLGPSTRALSASPPHLEIPSASHARRGFLTPRLNCLALPKCRSCGLLTHNSSEGLWGRVLLRNAALHRLRFPNCTPSL